MTQQADIGGGFVLIYFKWLCGFHFDLISEKLTTQLRVINFTALFRQNIGFFDGKDNATGALTADLATNATKVTFLTGESFARLALAVFTPTAGLFISFVFGSWLLTCILGLQ